eukprot:16447577-Heterocapsa_arctica.AAC.1
MRGARGQASNGRPDSGAVKPDSASASAAQAGVNGARSGGWLHAARRHGGTCTTFPESRPPKWP